jgi:hypothetical protein
VPILEGVSKLEKSNDDERAAELVEVVLEEGAPD